MSDYLPTRQAGPSSGVVPAGLSRQAIATRRAERGLERHALNRAFAIEQTRIDTRAVGEVITTSLEEEFHTYDYGMYLAKGSAAKQELLARKLEMMSQLNNRLITHRFGR